MKRFLILLLIPSVAFGWTQQATDLFVPCQSGNGHSGEDITTSTGNWTSTATGILPCNGDAGGTFGQNTNNSDKLLAIYYFSNAVSFLTDQYSSKTLALVPNDAHAGASGVAVRVQASGQNCYFLEYSNQGGTKNAILGVVNSGTVTAVVTTGVTYTDGVKLKLEVTGIGSASRLTGYADTGSGFVAISGMSAVDPGGTYLDGGKPGFWGRGVNPIADSDDWFGGDQSAATPTPTPTPTPGTGGGQGGFFIFP